MNKISKKAKVWFSIGVIFTFGLLCTLLMITERVSDGHVSVVYTPSQGAKEVLGPGWHLVGLLDKTYEFSVRQEVIKTSVDVNTSDGKKVNIPVTYNMRIDDGAALELFKLYGPRGQEYYHEVVVQQQLQKLAKETIAKYSTIDIFTTKMSEAGTIISENLTNVAEGKGFFVSDLALLSPELDASTQAAIDAQVQAQQDNELKRLQLQNDEIDQERAQKQAKSDEIKRQTEANAAAYEIKAAADAEAYANKVIAESLTEPILKKMELEARQKFGWVTIQGSNSVIVDETSK